MGFFESLLLSLLGVSVVFLVLIILMTCVNITSKVVGGKKSKEQEQPEKMEAASPVSVPETVLTPVYAKGSAGEVKTFDVPDRTAAVIMAVVADGLDIPLAQLRFRSIKEV